MQIIAVIDLLGGRAVHAKGGCRQAYRPVEIATDQAIQGDPGALARLYVEQLGIDQLYVADLDAIAGGAEQDVRLLADIAGSLWLDAGVSTVPQAQRALARGASRVVVGLETLPSLTALTAIADAIGSDRVAFSLDLRDGHPMTTSDALTGLTPETIARRAVAAGAQAVIVLDVARVGSGRGMALEMIARIRTAIPGVTLLAGGGLRGRDDLRDLSLAGCDGLLAATALHRPDARDLIRAAASTAGNHGNVTR